MIHTDVPLAILPAGTANVFAVEARLGLRIERAAQEIRRLCPRRISVGHLTCSGGLVSRYFLLMAGVGLDAHIVYRVNARLKSRAGKIAYWIAGWTLLGHSLPEFDAVIDGCPRHCSFALVSRVRNYGGDFSIARSVDLLQDSFEVVLFEGHSSLRYALYFFGLLFNRLGRMRGLTTARARVVKVGTPADRGVYVQIDGELAGHLPAEIRIVPDALTVLLPEDYGLPA
jgi:diacylglycerol kinase family enzyme